MSVPIRPVRPGDLISAAKFNEVVDEVNALGQISGSYPIEVARDAMGVRIGIARQFKAWLFRIETVPSTLPRTADNVPYYNATRLRLDPGGNYTAQSPQHVVLYDPLAKDSQIKLLTEGTWVLATFDSDTGRWQIVRDPYPGTQIVRFRLTTTLTLGTSATAVIRQWDQTAGGGAGAYVDGAMITVKDYFGALGDPGEWQAPNGYYGYAVRLADLNEYQILYMEHQAEFIAFTLTANMSAGAAAATFDSFWMGRNTASETTVYDRTGQWGTGKSGDKGIACWDSKLAQYVILALGLPARELVLFYLNADMVRGGSAAATIRVWAGAVWLTAGADVTVWDSTLLGPARTSDFGIAFLSSQSGRYEIVALNSSFTPKIQRFQLTEPLTLGGSATAQQVLWDGTEWTTGGEITVADFYGSVGHRGAWQAPAGYYGWAITLSDNPDTNFILTMEKVAVFATATLTEDMGHSTPGMAAANFGSGNKWWQGQDTGSAAAVYDPISAFSTLKNGKTVVCCYDDNEQKYKVIAPTPTSPGTILYARAYADHVLAGASKSNAHYVECQAVDDITGAGFDSGSGHFHVLLPSPSSATDPNVQSGTVIGYTVDPGGNPVCVTGYLEDARGIIKIWSGEAADVPHGWGLCDGSDGAPDLQGRFVMAARPGGGDGPFDDDGSDDDVGDTGGILKHTHAAHAPATTSAVALTATSTVSNAVAFIGTPTVFTFTPNMTGSPIASGTTGPVALEAETFFPNVTIEPTTLDDSHIHTIELTEETPKNDGAEPAFMVESTISIVSTDAASGWLSPNPHTHDVTETDSELGEGTEISPNPHQHSVTVPVTGITFSPTTIPYTPAGNIAIDTSVFTTINPSSHAHQTPTLSHSPAYHTPKYFALCYIMRTS